jgi:hypothetical protein
VIIVVKTIGIKDFLLHVFPVIPTLVQKQNPDTSTKDLVAKLADVDERIEKNRIRLRNAVIRMTSMGRVSEIFLNTYYPRGDEVAYEVLVAYRSILMEEYHITENDLIPVEEAIRMMKSGDL